MENKKNSGFIVIYRSILNWEWYGDNNTKSVFLHLLLKANHKDENWHGVTVKRGQVITSVRNIAKETSLTVNMVRTALKHLESTHEITQSATPKYTLISIQKYDDYQNKSHSESRTNHTVEHKQITHNFTTNNKEEQVNKEEQERDGGTAAMKPGFWEDQ